jgi:2-dehydropantoate 2-reductase
VTVLVVGAGAIGGYVGAHLARTGCAVTLVARGAHGRAMRDHGLRVIGEDGEFTVRPPVVHDLHDAGPADVVILAVKAHSLSALAPSLPALLGPDSVIVSTQNGIPWWYFQRQAGPLRDHHLERVDPGGVIARTIDPRRVIGSVVYLAATVLEPGVVRHGEGNRITLGELDDSRSERCSVIARALKDAGFRCHVSTHVRQEIWLKLLGNVVFNPISALTGATLEEIARHPDAAALVREAMVETRAVAERLGITIPITIEQRIAAAESAGAHKTSMLQDVEAGRPTERDAVVGAVVELGERLGMSMPATRTLYACLSLLEDTRARRTGS